MNSKVVATVRKIEALVAEREIRNLLVPQRHCQPHPVVERGIDDLKLRELAAGVGQGHMGNLAAPAFDELNGQMVGFQRTDARLERSFGQRQKLVFDV